MHRYVLLPAIALLLASCGDDARPQPSSVGAPAAPQPSGTKPAPGSFHEGGAFKAFYGEELHEGRIYVFGQQPAYDAFVSTHQIDITKAKTYIGEGPNHETVIVQTDKEAPQMTDRVYKQFKQRYGLN